MYTKELVRGLLHDRVWESLRGSDPQILLPGCEALGLSLCVSPSTEAQKAVIQEHWLRRDLQQPVTMVSDGVFVLRGTGFAAILLHWAGVAAHFSCHMAVVDPTSWAAEWLGRALSVIVLQWLRVG